MRAGLAVIALVTSLAACGDSVAPDAVVALRIVSPVAMPFHGTNGPGREPISINFSWTVVIAASEGAATRVAVVRTELTERKSGTVVVRETFPSMDLPPGGELRLEEQSGGSFPSALYPGDWAGVTTVQVAHGSGAAETLTAAFSFP
jgi:hypothetical protein